MLTRRFLSPLAVLILALAPGCTAMAKYDDAADAAPFSATSNTALAVSAAAVGYEPPVEKRTSFDFILMRWTIPVWLANLPVALAWDLVTLPYDLATTSAEEWGQAEERRWAKLEVATGGAAPEAPSTRR